MSVLTFFDHPLWSRLAAMHGHFLWQGFLIAWLYWTLVKLFAVESARVRYLLGMSGLAAMMIGTIATFFVVEGPQRERPNELARTNVSEETFAEEDSLAESPLISEGRGDNESRLSLRETASIDAANEVTPSFPERKATFEFRQGSESTSEIPIANHEPPLAESQSLLIPVLLGGWFLGVTILGLRLMAGIGTVAWWRWSSLPVADPRWVGILERLSQRLGMKRCPRLAVSLKASDAFSLGLVRPLIIVPAAWLFQLPPGTLESVLAHELAHIRRWDAWANLFQRVLEAWLFYHPAVWWLSRQVEKEREKCCDLWAVSLTGDRLLYVKTLAEIAELKHANRPAMLKNPILATGMGGRNMVLLERVRHILGETPRTGAASRFLAGAMVLAIPSALWMGAAMLPASADEGDQAVAQAEGDEDGNRRRDGDAPKKGPRDGERPRGDAPRDGERDVPEGRRDGDRERPEGRRDGDRPDRERGDRPDRDREGDRPDRERGDRPDREREGDRPEREGRPGLPGFPPRNPFGPPRFRDGEGPRGISRKDLSPQAEMLLLIRELRQEVEQLRREVRELKEAQGNRPVVPRFRREGEFRRGEFRPDGERDRGFRRPDREREREGDAVEREREGERRDGDAAEREIEREIKDVEDGERRDGDAAEREIEREIKDVEDGERLEKAREERDREGVREEFERLGKLEASAEAEKVPSKKIDQLRRAAEGYEQLFNKHRSQVAGVYARFDQARCLQKLGKTEEAQAIFRELLKVTGETEPLKRFQEQLREQIAKSEIKPIQK